MEKDNNKVPEKVGVNHRLHILHMSKIMVHCYTTGKNINQFEIGYMINPSLKFNKAFRTQVKKWLGVSFSIRKMNFFLNLMNKNTCDVALIMIY